MRTLDEIVEKNKWILILWGMLAGLGVMISIAMGVEILFPG